MILDSSNSMRRIIKTMIQATVNDAVVSEASDSQEAMDLFAAGHYHVALFSRESSDQKWLDFAKEQSGKPEAQRSNFVLFTSSKKEDFLEEIKQYGIEESVIIPCSANDLGQLITRICHPFVMRTARRYSAPNTVVHMSQGSNSLSAEVINFSEGGMLCELDAPDGYNWAAPLMSKLEFNLDGTVLVASGLYSVLSRLMVVESNPDFSPKRIRLACRFVNVGEKTKAELVRVFENIEKQEEGFSS